MSWGKSSEINLNAIIYEEWKRTVLFRIPICQSYFFRLVLASNGQHVRRFALTINLCVMPPFGSTHWVLFGRTAGIREHGHRPVCNLGLLPAHTHQVVSPAAYYELERHDLRCVHAGAPFRVDGNVVCGPWNRYPEPCYKFQ